MTDLFDPQTEWARLLLGAFADAGVTEVITSPGSRSTPFVLAAQAEPRLTVRSIVDERAAAFYALGQGKATGRPSLLLCTSGSAPAHYLPAILEARATRSPLIALTADRPLEAQGAGAPQTCDQIKMFGDAARFYELGAVDPAPSALRGLRRIVAQAVALAVDGGAVQLNARARKPLEPRPATAEERSMSTLIRAARKTAPARHHPAMRTPDDDGLRRLAHLVAETTEGVILCGPRSPRAPALGPALRRFAARAGYPILAEATSALGAPAADELPLGALALVGRSDLARAGLRPRLVLQLGPTPVCAAAERLIAEAHAVEIISTHDDVDADNRAHAIHLGDPALACARLEALLAERALDRSASPFGAAWALATLRARRIETTPTDELAHVAALLDALPDCALFLGNSLPVREIDLACALGARPPSRVFHQRGTSGIDGLVAGAAGVASAVGPTVLLLGDVSLLHDLHGLLVAAEQRAPLVVAVLCNGGGRIFDTLPIGRRDDLRAALPLLTTPSTHDLGALARFAGVAHLRCDRSTDVAAALTQALAVGPTLLELVVDPASAARVEATLSIGTER